MKIDCYTNAVPEFAEQTLARLYGHVSSSLPFFKVFKSLDRVHTYLTRQDGEITSLLLFECSRGRATVFNEGIGINEQALDRFARHVFQAFPDVHVIHLNRIETDVRQLPFPFQRHNATDNYVLPLPPSPEKYTSALGKATRRNIKRYMGKMLEDHPSFACRFYSGAEIDRNQFSALIRMSEASMSKKKMRFGINADYAEQLWQLAGHAGFVSVATIDGKVCAGLICYAVQSYYFAQLVAHDSAYDSYMLGTMCYYLTIIEAIRRGGTIFNMGQMHYDYKDRFLATRHDLDRVAIYRSYRSGLLNLPTVARMAAGQPVRSARVWIHAHPGHIVTRVVRRAMYSLHRIRT